MNIKRTGLVLVALTAMLAYGASALSSPSRGAQTQKLVVWDWQYASKSWGQALKAVDAAFTKAHPGVQIEHVAQPQNNYYQLVQAANVARSGPDVLMMHAGTFGVLNYTDSLETLNSYIDPTLRKQLSGWEAVGENFNPNGKIYGVPGSRSGWVFYYNKALFKRAGLNPSRPPQTWAQLLAAAKKLKAAGITPFGGGNADQFGALMWLDDLFPGAFTRAQSVALAQGKVKYTSPQFKLVSQRFLDLYKAGYFPKGWASTVLWTEGVQQFNSGKAAIFAGIASDTISYREFNAGLGAKNVGVFYTPAITGRKRYYIPISSGPVWSMTTYAKNKPLAWQYIRFMTGVDGARIQWQVGGNLPINKGYTVPKSAPPQVRQMLHDFNTQPTFLYVSSLMKQAVVFEWMKQMQAVVSGQESLDGALKNVQKKQDSPIG